MQFNNAIKKKPNEKSDQNERRNVRQKNHGGHRPVGGRKREGLDREIQEEKQEQGDFAKQIPARSSDEMPDANRQGVARLGPNPRILLSAGTEDNLDNFMTQANQILKVRKHILEKNKELRSLNSSIGELKTEIKSLRNGFEKVDGAAEKKQSEQTRANPRQAGHGRALQAAPPIRSPQKQLF